MADRRRVYIYTLHVLITGYLTKQQKNRMAALNHLGSCLLLLLLLVGTSTGARVGVADKKTADPTLADEKTPSLFPWMGGLVPPRMFGWPFGGRLGGVGNPPLGRFVPGFGIGNTPNAGYESSLPLKPAKP